MGEPLPGMAIGVPDPGLPVAVLHVGLVRRWESEKVKKGLHPASARRRATSPGGRWAWLHVGLELS